MRYYLFLPLLLVGSLTGCAVYGGGYGHSDYERVYRPAYEVRSYPVYVVPPRYSSRYYEPRRDDYRPPPRYYAPPLPPRNVYRPPMQQGWNAPRYQDRSWGNSFDQRNQYRAPPPPPSQRYDNRRGEVRGWEIRR